MFLFKNKKKKKSSPDLSHQDSVSNDIYVQDDHLLNIKLPDDFSSIILPQLIGYEQDENGNTINSSAIILRQKQPQQQHPIQPEENHHTHPSTREGWYPVTRLVGSESNRGTLVDTTNITAASLVQVNKRQSSSLSSSSGDTLTCHSKEDSSGSLDLDESHTPLFFSSPCHSEKLNHASSCLSHLQKDRPKFKRNHPRSTIPAPTILNPRSDTSSSSPRTLKKSIKPPTPYVLPESLAEKNVETSVETNIPLIRQNDDDKKGKKIKEKASGVKLSNESSLKRQHQQQKKRSSVILSSTVPMDPVASMIPRRPLSCSSYSSQNDKTTTVTPAQAIPKMKKTKQTRTMNVTSSAMGGSSRIPVRSQTMKV